MFHRFSLFLSLCALCNAFATTDSLLWNHVGYERTGPKTAVVKNSGGAVATTGFQLLDASGAKVFEGLASASSQVPGWGNSDWKVLDFSAFQDSGNFCLKLLPGPTVSDTFSIRDENLLRATGPAVVSFFHAMESKDDGDRKIDYFGQPARGTHDVYGGWMDATGDDGKYISHLSYANFMNPQQIPMVVWALLRANLLAPVATAGWKTSLLSEAAWGADYLVRIQDTQGYFYINVFRSHWAGSSPKEICAWIGDSASQGTQTSDYQAAWREGGGMAIAALALAARLGVSGDFGSSQYLVAAVKGFEHLSARRGRWADDGRENLIDHYCALLAAVELFQATGIQRYADSAGARADSIVARQQAAGWFLSDNGGRPFFHGVDEGLPMTALATYLEIDPSSPRANAVRTCLARSVNWYRSLTREVANPFLYPRMYAPNAPGAGAISGGGGSLVAASVSASSTQDPNAATNAVDGSLTTRWGSSLTDSTAWIRLDLGQVAFVDSVAIYWEPAYAKKYALLLSKDGSRWDTAFVGGAASGNAWDGNGFVGDSARYVKMQGIQRANASYGYSMYEFRVFGALDIAPVTDVPSSKRFFMPHKNETGYWWQGENARLGSISTALLLAGRAAQPGWTLSPSDSLSQEAVAGLDWVLGKNIAGLNFLFGVKDGTTAAYNGGTNQVGGICNGITAVSDADQSPVFNNDGGVANWRWVEQWLPHDANYLLGIASLAHLLEVPPDAIHPVPGLRPTLSVTSGSGRIRASLPTPAEWTLRDPSGRMNAHRSGTASVEFAPGRGTWILEARRADGIRQVRIAVLP